MSRVWFSTVSGGEATFGNSSVSCFFFFVPAQLPSSIPPIHLPNLHSMSKEIFKLISNATLDRSEPGSNSNEEVYYNLQISRTEASPPDAVWCHTRDTRSERGRLCFPFALIQWESISPIHSYE